MKVSRSDKFPQINDVNEMKSQIALGVIDEGNLWDIVQEYTKSKYYLTEEVLTFIEDFLDVDIQLGFKNKYYLREATPKRGGSYPY